MLTVYAMVYARRGGLSVSLSALQVACRVLAPEEPAVTPVS